MSARPVVSRREFLRAGVAAGTGLVLAFYLPGCAPGEKALAGSTTAPGAGSGSGLGSGFRPNAWLAVGQDGHVRIAFDKAEMGQGVMTALPTIVADELDVDWGMVHVEPQPDRPDKWIRNMGTGGSTSVRRSWQPLREAGAAAREMLVAAAAKRWGVPADSCRTVKGRVEHPATRRVLGYGELVDAAAKQPVPAKPTLKTPGEFRYIGTAVPRIDIPSKTDGTAVFGIDVQRPGLLVAVVERCPVFGGKLRTFDATAAMKVPGVHKVVAIGSGVAIVADGYWEAMTGRKALKVQWDLGPAATASSASIRAAFVKRAAQPGVVARNDGDAAGALRTAAKRLSAVYELPYLAHATMEPMNCTADVRADGAEVWAPMQSQSNVQNSVAKALGLDVSKVVVHTTFLGGGFGRRSEADFAVEAAQASKAAGAPVKVIWSREDDMRHDFYRPAAYHAIEAGLDRAGRLIAWHHRLVAPSIMARRAPHAMKGGLDRQAVEGLVHLDYAIPNMHVEYGMPDAPVPVGFWRSVNFSHNVFAVEGFVDELAEAAHADPYRFRRALLASQPRNLAVLDLAARKGGWGSKPPAGRSRGIAFANCFGTRTAYVAEVSVQGAKVRVHRLVAAVDPGQVVNPNTVVAQIQSAAVYGLTAALRGDITLKDGRVVQGNFDTYPMLRMNEMPEMEVHIVPNHEAPGGMGEPGLPAVAPAVVAAIYAATGRRLRRLPIEGQLA